MRVQIPAYTGHWMKGDRYGEVVRQSVRATEEGDITLNRVKLDKSGKVISVIADDCTEVDAEENWNGIA